ncbi:hypothetical protein BVRB_9g222640 [Beta vulgaris subsp. vulgaris]|nr:hypothetical protein BVRB_9g222640 [Beta vulgaris subsp. vulgaris]
MRVGLLFSLVLLLLLTDMVIFLSVARSIILRSDQSSVDDTSNNNKYKFKLKEGGVVIDDDKFVGNVTDLDDKRRVPTGSNPLHNR